MYKYLIKLQVLMIKGNGLLKKKKVILKKVILFFKKIDEKLKLKIKENK